MKKISLFLCFIGFHMLGVSQIQLGQTNLDTTTIYSSLNEPWEILVNTEDSNLLITEKSGLVSRFNPNTFVLERILDIRTQVWQVGECGLLGMAFSPDFLTDRKLFLAYTYTSGNLNYLKVTNYT